MNEVRRTIGTAIDQIVEALTTFEDGDKQTILRTVCAHLKLNVFPPQTALAATPQAAAPPPLLSSQSAPPPLSGLDIRSLKEQKKPASAKQMACLVAYYLQDHAPDGERKQLVSTADLEKYFKQASFKLPEKMDGVLPDAKRSGYFESMARGQYKLTRVGYNLVTHSMPSRATE